MQDCLSCGIDILTHSGNSDRSQVILFNTGICNFINFIISPCTDHDNKHFGFGTDALVHNAYAFLFKLDLKLSGELCIVIVAKRDANAGVVLNKLFKMTALQSSFSVNIIALVGGRPKCLTLKDMIKCLVDHRHVVVIRRTMFELRKAK